MDRTTAAIVGAGRVGSDLMMKLQRAAAIELAYVVDSDPAAPGLRTAHALGVESAVGGADWLLTRDVLPDIVFDVTTARAHVGSAFRYAEAGIFAVDLTLAMLGPVVLPSVNLGRHVHEPNLSIGTCVGQAAAPVVRAIAGVAPVSYAEVSAALPAASTGPATRSSFIDFGTATSTMLRELGGADSASTVVVLDDDNDATSMRITVACAVPRAAEPGPIAEAVADAIRGLQSWMPGARLRREINFDRTHRWPGCGLVTAALEVTTEGESPATYAGNLAILSAAAVSVGQIRSEALVAP